MKCGAGLAPTYCSPTRTAESNTVQPKSVGNPTSGGSGVVRQIAARAASLKTDHTLTTLHRQPAITGSGLHVFTINRPRIARFRRQVYREICIAPRAHGDYGMAT